MWNSLTFPWQLSNSQTFPDKWSGHPVCNSRSSQVYQRECTTLEYWLSTLSDIILLCSYDGLVRNINMHWVRPGASSQSWCQSSLQSTSLSRHAARCSQLAFGQLCSMVVRPGPQTPTIYNGFAEMTVPWSGGSAVQSWKMRFPRLCFTKNWI